MAEQRDRTVILGDETTGEERSILRARMTSDGGLELEGQDFGPSTSMVSDDGEYEYYWEVPAKHLAALREELEVPAEGDLLDVLVEHCSGPASRHLESLVSSSGLGRRSVI